MARESPTLNAASGRCPRCGTGRLFAGFLGLAPCCDACGLSYRFADAGDGPAVFVSFVAGALVCGGAVWVELAYQPPYWVHAALWLPLAVIIPVALLRPSKGLLIGLQYRNSAHEGERAGHG